MIYIEKRYKMCKKITVALVAIVVLVLIRFPIISWAVNPLDLSFTVKELMPVTLDYSKATVLNSSEKGIEIANNSTFADLSQSSYGASVSRMSALGVLHNDSNGKVKNFEPDKLATGYGALFDLVNMAGRYNVVQTRIASQTSGMNNTMKQLLSDREYLLEARNLGLISPSEEKYLKTSVPREVFGLWIARVVGLLPSTGNLEMVSVLKDGSLIDPNNKAIMETLISDGILVPDKNQKIRPTAGITKGEMLYAMDKSINASTTITSALGITSDFGLVIGKNVKLDKNNGTSTLLTDWIVRKSDGSILKLRTTSEKPSGRKTDFAVFKNKNLGLSSKLAVGDEIEYYSKNAKIVFVRKIAEDSIMAKATEDIKKEKGLIYSFGVVGEKRIERVWTGNGYQLTTRLRIQNYDGEVADFVIQSKQSQEILNDVLVSKKGRIGGLELLEKGDKIEYLLKNENQVVYAFLKNYSLVTYQGNIKRLGQDATSGLTVITLYGFDNQVRQFPLANYAIIRYGTGYGKIKDLIQNQEVTLNVVNGYITNLTVTDQNENGGYIPENGKIRMGKVLNVIVNAFKDQYLQLKLASGDEVQVQVDKTTQLLKDGKGISFTAIKAGDPVKLYYSNISDNVPSKIEVESIPAILKQIYKGELADIDFHSKTLLINNVSYLKNTSWGIESVYKKGLHLTPETEIYYNDNPITAEELLKNHVGETLYVAVQDSFGTEATTKINVKKGGEQTFFDRIGFIDQIQKVMELKNSVNVGVGDGTIVIKDGRLISRNNLSVLDNILVVASSGGSNYKSANVINVVTTADKVFSKLVIGTIDSVDPNSFTLDYFSELQANNTWGTLMRGDGSLHYSLTADSVITDLTLGKSITPQDLFHGKYGKNDNVESSPGGQSYKKYYCYFVLDDNNEIVALNLRKKGIFPNNFIDDSSYSDTDLRIKFSNLVNGLQFSKGSFDSIDTSLIRMKMTSVYDWSQSKSQWLSNSVDAYIRYDNAIFIKNNQVISYNNVQPNDVLYVVRGIENAMVVFVESN